MSAPPWAGGQPGRHVRPTCRPRLAPGCERAILVSPASHARGPLARLCPHRCSESRERYRQRRLEEGLDPDDGDNPNAWRGTDAEAQVGCLTNSRLQPALTASPLAPSGVGRLRLRLLSCKAAGTGVLACRPVPTPSPVSGDMRACPALAGAHGLPHRHPAQQAAAVQLRVSMLRALCCRPPLQDRCGRAGPSLADR